MLNVIKANGGGACPSQFFGITADNKKVYARYRWGCLTVTVDDEEVILSKRLGRNLTEEDDARSIEKFRKAGMGEDFIKMMDESRKTMRKFMAEQGDTYLSFDGSMSYEKMKEETKEAVNWPEKLDSGDLDW